MPLLAREVVLYPDVQILAEPHEPDALEDVWWVAHTRPRAEKMLARRLCSLRVPFFLPTYEKTWVRHGRVFSSFLPMFPGYAFLRGGDARDLAIRTNQVANVLPVADTAQLRADLNRIHQLMESSIAVEPEAHLLPGTEVLLTRGPFAGWTGTVLRRGSSYRFFVEVRFLHQGVSIEIDGRWIRPVTDGLEVPTAESLS